jgi:sugar/nucleoside kinase (ribokinase family)
LGSEKFDVLAVGDGCLDVILTGLDGGLEEKQVLRGCAQHVIPGGGFTTPVVLQWLGVKVTWAADFGSDIISKFIQKTAEDEGVDLHYSRLLKRNARRISVSLSTLKNRSFLSYEDASPFVPAAFHGLLCAKATAVYMPGTRLDKLFLLGARIARFRNMTIIVDGNGADKYRLDQNVVKQCLQYIDILILNTDEALSITEENAPENALIRLAALSKQVVMKDGANGALFLDKGEVRHVPAIPVAAVDTTGAGDNFNAGFIAAWLRGKTVEECAAWGNITAGLSTTVPGGATMKIYLNDILSWMQRYPEMEEGWKF